jgi:hypothetical protein
MQTKTNRFRAWVEQTSCLFYFLFMGILFIPSQSPLWAGPLDYLQKKFELSPEKNPEQSKEQQAHLRLSLCPEEISVFTKTPCLIHRYYKNKLIHLGELAEKVGFIRDPNNINSSVPPESQLASARFSTQFDTENPLHLIQKLHAEVVAQAVPVLIMKTQFYLAELQKLYYPTPYNLAQDPDHLHPNFRPLEIFAMAMADVQNLASFLQPFACFQGGSYMLLAENLSQIKAAIDFANTLVEKTELNFPNPFQTCLLSNAPFKRNFTLSNRNFIHLLVARILNQQIPLFLNAYSPFSHQKYYHTLITLMQQAESFLRGTKDALSHDAFPNEDFTVLLTLEFRTFKNLTRKTSFLSGLRANASERCQTTSGFFEGILAQQKQYPHCPYDHQAIQPRQTEQALDFLLHQKLIPFYRDHAVNGVNIITPLVNYAVKKHCPNWKDCDYGHKPHTDELGEPLQTSEKTAHRHDELHTYEGFQAIKKSKLNPGEKELMSLFISHLAAYGKVLGDATLTKACLEFAMREETFEFFKYCFRKMSLTPTQQKDFKTTVQKHLTRMNRAALLKAVLEVIDNNCPEELILFPMEGI